MAKNQATGSVHRGGAMRENRRAGKGVAATSRFSDKAAALRPKSLRREILFPTEPSTIGNEKIDRAIERVTSRRK
ncbi:MAG TPA: hypothetical protein VNN08_02215 [Thermoanaerobaculia bacterium]|nr:hypothetical protein [Thermoanaerobaculia bacterium]